MRTKVQKWGNSLAVRIPKAFAGGAGLRLSEEVEISIERGGVRIAPVRPTWKLARLLAAVTKRNLHPEIESGSPVGREVW